MANITSIRFFENIPVRAVWDEESAKWWFCATDIAEALTKSKKPRVYWATVKRRNPQLIAICKQLKLKAKDGKQIIDEISAKESIKTECKILKQPAEAFKMKKSIEDISKAYPGKMPAKEKRELNSLKEALESVIPGNTE